MTDILDTAEAPLLRTPAQFFFETGYFAAYADVTFRRKESQLTDAVIERAWAVAHEGHPDPAEFDRYLSSANSADARLAEAEATYRAFDEANREADGSREGLTMGAQALRMYGADLFPANRAGQVHFARVLMDSVASVIEAALAAPKPSPGRPVLTCTGIAMVEVTDADRAEFERGLFTQGYPAERAKQLAFEQEPNDAALQMLARHRLASASAGKLDRDYTSRRIKELMDEGDGFWRACSGCQEGVDGYVSERDYPFDPTFRCQPGGGCSECGGIGVLWDDGHGYDDITGDEEPASVPAGDGDIGLLEAARDLLDAHKRLNDTVRYRFDLWECLEANLNRLQLPPATAEAE